MPSAGAGRSSGISTLFNVAALFSAISLHSCFTAAVLTSEPTVLKTHSKEMVKALDSNVTVDRAIRITSVDLDPTRLSAEFGVTEICTERTAVMAQYRTKTLVGKSPTEGTFGKLGLFLYPPAVAVGLIGFGITPGESRPESQRAQGAGVAAIGLGVGLFGFAVDLPVSLVARSGSRKVEDRYSDDVVQKFSRVVDCKPPGLDGLPVKLTCDEPCGTFREVEGQVGAKGRVVFLLDRQGFASLLQGGVATMEVGERGAARITLDERDPSEIVKTPTLRYSVGGPMAGKVPLRAAVLPCVSQAPDADARYGFSPPLADQFQEAVHADLGASGLFSVVSKVSDVGSLTGRADIVISCSIRTFKWHTEVTDASGLPYGGWEVGTDFSVLIPGGGLELETYSLTGTERERESEAYPHRPTEHGELQAKAMGSLLASLRKELSSDGPTLVRKVAQGAPAAVSLPRGGLSRQPAPILPAAATSDVDEPPKTGVSNRHAVAVVIGNRDYVSAPRVEFAVNDAQVVRRYLVEALGFHSENVLYEENATKARLEAIFGTQTDPRGKLSNYLRPGKSDVFVYYSGHGAPDVDSHEAFLMPVDAEPDYIGQTGYPLSRLYDSLGKLPARWVTVVLDACFSGESGAGALLGGTSPLVTRVNVPQARMRNGSVFTAASTGQVAVWHPEEQHGLFTYYFLKGLSGEADLDQSGKLSAGELQAYLEVTVPPAARRLKGREQTPLYYGTSRNKVLLSYR